jgi:hypothetical protein
MKIAIIERISDVSKEIRRGLWNVRLEMIKRIFGDGAKAFFV